MSTTIIRTKPESKHVGQFGKIDLLLRRIVFRQLSQLKKGRLIISDELSDENFGGDIGYSAEIRVKDPAFYRKAVTGGSIGAAEAYMDGLWECDDLTSLFRLFVANLEVIDGIDQSFWSGIGSFASRLFHLNRKNSRQGSRTNIQEHYDLGNDLFSLFLDPTMTYSAGIFETADSTLQQASLAKLDRVCRKLRLNPADEVLEIGTGWGSFAIHAASQFGCSVTTTTISDQQYQLATERVRAAGLIDKVKILKKDYRDLEGKFDKLVSIEMIEAVGHEYLETFFKTCSSLLKPEGQMLIQAITMADQRYRRYLKSVDFIQRYIFPGSCLASVSTLTRMAGEHTDLRVVDMEEIGPHYATTLRHWKKRFNENLSKVLECGYSERFTRLWNYYLSYCEAGFQERYLGDVQVLFHKPACRSALPALEFRCSGGGA